MILQFSLFSTGTEYGQDDPVESYTLCFLKKGSGSEMDEILWQNFSFLALCILSFIFILCLSLRVLFHHCNRNFDSLIQREALNGEKLTIMLIPLGLFISWIPSFFFQFRADRYYRLHNSNPPKYVTDINALSCLNPLYGIFLAILIYARTEKPREKWFITIYNYLYNKDNMTENENDDYSSDQSSTPKSNELPSRTKTNESLRISISPVHSLNEGYLHTSNELPSRISEISQKD
jgi:hypothetical protein